MEEGWERPPRVELSAAQLAQLIEPAFPGKAIAETSVLATGTGQDQPVLPVTWKRGELPDGWLPLSRLIDVLSQLTFLNDASERPRVFAETTEVVKETMGVLARWLPA